MRRCVFKLLFLGVAVTAAAPAAAQPIAFAPAAPTSGEAVRVLFSEPFACDAPVPALTARVADTFVFESVFPSGIVNCPMIPSPPPQTSSFSVAIGELLPGSYAVTWKIYVRDTTGARKLVSDSSAAFDVRAAEAAAPRRVPALSTGTLLALIALSAAAAARRLRRRAPSRATWHR